MHKIAVVLSGCGVFDGSEIHESILTLLAIDQQGASYQCLAPNVTQTKVVNHLNQQPADEQRNVLVEAARIARGNIIDIKQANAADFDAAIFPGGFGAVLNLSNFAIAGADCDVQADVLKFGKAMAQAGKPMGFICIAPTMISKIYGPGILQTIGNDAATAQTITTMGGEHQNCTVREIAIDEKRKVVSTPAYMLAQHISEAADGINKLVDAISAMVKETSHA